MRGKLVVTENWKEREAAEDLSIEIPEEIIGHRDIYFKLTSVETGFINSYGEIKVNISGTFYELKFSEILWTKIKKHLDNE